MHRSRLAGFIIDCRTDDLAAAASFWSDALGMRAREMEGDQYVPLDDEKRDLHLEVQRVTHESRLHLDIEADDVDAEALRLERIGARRIGKVKTWWVMEAPTGQRFCIVRGKNMENAVGVTIWP